MCEVHYLLVVGAHCADLALVVLGAVAESHFRVLIGLQSGELLLAKLLLDHITLLAQLLQLNPVKVHMGAILGDVVLHGGHLLLRGGELLLNAALLLLGVLQVVVNLLVRQLQVALCVIKYNERLVLG